MAEGEGPSYRAGFVALLGPPNVGKSTLLNRLLGEKLAIVSPRPQTTRSRILGILTLPGAQLLLQDTPGLHEGSKKLNEALNQAVAQVAADCDVGLVLVDRTLGWSELHDDLVARLRAAAKPILIVVTKCDVDLEGPRPPPARVAELPTIEISARTGEGVAGLLEQLVAALPESSPLYAEDELTDRPLRWLCGELVREALFECLRDELPYSVAVEVQRFDEGRPDLVVIDADILVARSSQKGIVVGAGGSMIKRIGTRARQGIEHLIGRRAHLQLFVKVDPKWLKSARRIEELGYF